ncbi:hypothetical protein D3C87_1917670 [compost metagenome]
MIIQMELADFVGTGGNHYNPSLFSCNQPLQQQIRQQKVTQMVHAKIHLVSVCCELSFDRNNARIINQHVKHWITGRKCLHKSADTIQ